MIFFKPITDPENISEIIFEAIEDENVSGNCKMFINGDKAEVISVSYNPDKSYLVEGLLKAAFNFACSKNCYMGYCKCKNISDILDKMNFQKENDTYYNDIPSILMGNCCKKA